MARPKRPVASASAKPRNAKGCTWLCEAGLRATELISAENTLPMPTPAPTSAMQARPAPIILAEARSMCGFLLKECDAGSVQMQCVAQVKTGQNREDIGLQHGDQQFEADQRHVDGQRKHGYQPDARGKAAEDRQHRVPGQHVGEEP